VYVSLLALTPKDDFDSCYDDLKQGNVFLCRQVVIVGNGAVGKSSMIQRYCKGTFTKDYKKTIGVDFLERQIE
jgi:Ras-related protein Rab-23